ncbi:MAG: PEP-CTERM sorting domain-containing protein [Isosphaeraceae bacterium]
MTATTRKIRLSDKADRILARAATALAAATGAGLVSQAGTAQADIIYSGPVNINVPSTTAGIYLNVVTGVSSASPGAVPGWDINPWGSSSFFIWANTATSGTGVVTNFAGGSSSTLTDNLPVGTIVDGSYSYAAQSSVETTGPTAFLVNSANNYIGFRFFNESTNSLNYGWMQFSLSSSLNGQPRSIVAYAYENTGAAIRVGAVPEPATLAMLATGVAGLAAFRLARRRAV